MLVLEYKLIAKETQEQSIASAMRTVQFIRNKALRLWMDTGARQYDLNKYCAVLAKDYTFANALNSQARQAAAERAAYGIGRYLKADKSGKRLKKPKFQKDNRSVEYKTTGWKLSKDRKRITFTDGIGIGEVKLMGTQDFIVDPFVKTVKCLSLRCDYSCVFSCSDELHGRIEIDFCRRAVSQ